MARSTALKLRIGNPGPVYPERDFRALYQQAGKEKPEAHPGDSVKAPVEQAGTMMTTSSLAE